MKNFTSHFKFNKQERSGIFFLLLIIISLQVGYFVFRSLPTDVTSSFSSDMDMQANIDLLKEKALQKDSDKMYPFNPNFITDYKGYALGMSIEEIDRLHAYRAKDKYVNSLEDFQKVTQVSDSLLASFSSYFKFPEWTKKKNGVKKNANYKSSNTFKTKKQFPKNNNIEDLNTATAEDLMVVNGIGEVLSKRIVKYRNRLGGFLIEEQLYEVYFLEPEIAERVLTKFKLFNKPVVEKININEASAYEISSLVYIKYDLAKKIVAFRDENGSFTSLNELRNIESFPTEKIDRIALYLSL